MDSNFNELFAKKRELEKQNEEKRKEASRTRLIKDVSKRMNTCFIGALDAIEKNMGFLWEGDYCEQEAQEEMRRIFQNVRKEILDNGNNQIREFKGDLLNYDVKYNGFTMTLPYKGE